MTDTASAAPAGWKLVPVNPDISMQIAAKKADMDHSPLPDWLVRDWPEFLRIWNAMLAASPTPPAEQQAITPETGNSASAKGAAITSESGKPPAEQQAANKAAPECATCNDHGAVGNILTAEPCPDCTATRGAPKAAPVVWLSSKQLRGVTALHGQYLPFRCQPEGRFDTPVYLVEAAPKAAPAEQNTVPAEWLEQAYREGWAACRDAETIGDEAEDWAFGNSTANSRMIDAQQAAPQQEARPCHVFTVRKAGGLTEWEPTTMALALPDGAHALYTLPQPSPHAHADSVTAPMRQGKWTWVPVEPSTAMLVAGNHGRPGDFSALKVWEDMLGALDRSFDYTRPVDPPSTNPPAQAADRMLEDAALLLESQHTWLTNIAAANLVRSLAARARLGEKI